MGNINWKTAEEIEQEKANAPKSEMEIIKEDNAALNLQIIDLYEILTAGGVI